MTDVNQQSDVMPKHVAIIMDGNGRWAKQKGKLRTFGHKAGADAVRAAVRFCLQNNIEALTLFAFSSENWQRPADEVKALMELFVWALGSEAKKLNRNNVRLKVIGDLSRFDAKLKAKITEAEQLTQNNTAMVLNIAANYGGKWDITNACKQLLKAAIEQQTEIDAITEQDLSKFIQLNELPDIDLLIRTGGEQRISNFLIWQLAYSELYFCATLWPDFDEAAFSVAVKEYAGRQRRFGMTGEQIESQH